MAPAGQGDGRRARRWPRDGARADVTSSTRRRGGECSANVVGRTPTVRRPTTCPQLGARTCRTAYSLTKSALAIRSSCGVQDATNCIVRAAEGPRSTKASEAEIVIRAIAFSANRRASSTRPRDRRRASRARWKTGDFPSDRVRPSARQSAGVRQQTSDRHRPDARGEGVRCASRMDDVWRVEGRHHCQCGERSAVRPRGGAAAARGRRIGVGSARTRGRCIPCRSTTAWWIHRVFSVERERQASAGRSM